uniref:Zinc fingers and homeoboxes 3b n=1 Tax=Callorhinchus milii TaxID=7868 RepID=A0A4W3J4T0_CALMI|eukprot:gi/632973922/ref/XP_007903386.1/ PREDICTED: zinc fingers and homeoboxes protein 3 [Callorhinchus milii]
MASKRKSTTPCMIPAKNPASRDAETDANAEYDDRASSPQEEEVKAGEEALNYSEGSERGGFECKYCDFVGQDYRSYTVHMESEHSDASVDQLYVCVECNFSTKSQESLTLHNTLSHPDETNLKVSVIKRNCQMVVEQSISETKGSLDERENGEEEEAETGMGSRSGTGTGMGTGPPSEISISKTPIMKMLKAKPEAKRITVSHAGREELSEETGSADDDGKKSEAAEALEDQTANGLTSASQPINGTAVANLPVIQQAASRTKSSSLPKVMIPLSSIPTYNAAMDLNSFLNNSFNKFPYPTKAELCWLTVVTKYPEEQLKIWFTAQRLKHGISWTPEEIDDARKKMFNTIIQTVPQQTLTVLPSHFKTSNGGQQVFQTNLPCQVTTRGGNFVVSQPRLVKGVSMSGAPVALSVATNSKNQNIAKFHLQTLSDSGLKLVNAGSVLRPAMSVTSTTLSAYISDLGTYKYKKTKEQLAVLKDSFQRAQFPEHNEVDRLMKLTGLRGKEIRKWFSDRRYNYKNLKCHQSYDPSCFNTTVIDSALEDLPAPHSSASHQPRRQWQHTTIDFTPPKFRGKSAEQLSTLEHSFTRNTFPSEQEVDKLRVETKMTRREIDLWFAERRKVKPEERVAFKRRLEAAEAKEDGDSGEEEDDSDGEGTPSDSSSVDIKSIRRPPDQLKVSPLKICLKRGNNMCVQPKMSQANKTSASRANALTGSPIGSKYRGQGKKTTRQLHLMKLLFVRTHWPTVKEYDELAIKTGLARTEVVRWFGDARYGYKNGQLKWYDDYAKGMYSLRSSYNNTTGDVSTGSHPGRHSMFKKSGKSVLLEYYGQHKLLHEEDLDGLCEKSRMSYEQVRDWFAEKQTEDAINMSDFSNEDQNSANGESERMDAYKGRAGQAFGMEDVFSDVTDNSDTWDIRSRDGNIELNEFDAENVSEAE